jgi:hypothetical protein
MGLGWWAAAWTTDRANRIAARLEEGLSEADARLEQVEGRLATVRADLADKLGEAEKLASDNLELPRVRSAVERLLDRLLPTIDRAAALADSLRTVTRGLRMAEDIVAQLGAKIEQPSRANTLAEAIDRAADALNLPQNRIDALKSATAVRLARGLAELARESAAASEQLAEGLVDVRRELVVASERVSGWRSWFVSRVRVVAVAHTLVWLWLGLGQLCLIGWGTRRAESRRQ